MKVILTKTPNPEYYSLESGLADNIQHFDHHKEEHKIYPSPCNNPAIKKIPQDSIIQISHLDADTFIGYERLRGIVRLDLDFDLMEKIDCNGSSVCSDKYNSTYLFMVGIGVMARELGFPRITEEDQDVTNIINTISNIPTEEIIIKGEIATNKSEQDYKDCCMSKQGNQGLWKLNATSAFDPSRPYEDGIDIVVVYREHYKTISIYCNPKSNYAFAGKTIEGIEFNGHAQACGSPRGMEISWDKAVEVYSAI